MKRLSLMLVMLTVAAPMMAAAPEVKLTQAACKADLRSWSASRTETLTIAELHDHMNVMVACADLSKKHEKQVRAYLEEFYRTHTELADRAFTFITKHGLSEQFGTEENGTSSSQSSSIGRISEQ